MWPTERDEYLHGIQKSGSNRDLEAQQVPLRDELVAHDANIGGECRDGCRPAALVRLMHIR